MAVLNQDTYTRRVSQTAPKEDVAMSILVAFVVGGSICVVGQAVLNLATTHGMTAKEAAAPVSVAMVFLGSLLTALGWYDKLAKFSGMGAALPITGFSNSMTAPAMEFKREGFVLGLGARVFSVAGPVLVFGFTAAWLLAMASWALGKAGIQWGIGG